MVVAAGLAVARRWPPLLAMGAAGVLFAPQLPTLAYQSAHTGTPWALPPQVRAVPDTLIGWGGNGQHVLGVPLGLGLLFLAVLGALTVPGAAGSGPVVVWRGDPVGRVLAGLCVGPLVVAVAVAMATHSGYVARYTAVALPAYLLLVARGLTRLPRPAAAPVLAVLAVCGLVTGSSDALHSRTEAGRVAAAVGAATVPGDVVLYCPDQLAPAVHRVLSRLAPGRTEVSYGDPLGPERVDWVDYVAHNAALSPTAEAARALALAGTAHAVVLVGSDGYRTFGDQCGELAAALEQARPGPRVLARRDPGSGEPSQALLFVTAGMPSVFLGTAVPPHTPLLG